jgi:spoIIIJ-associated protein
MIKIEAVTLEEAYLEASSKLKCSVTQLQTEVIQHPRAGILGVFKKSAIIVATKKIGEPLAPKPIKEKEKQEDKLENIVKEPKDAKSKVENIIKKVISIKKDTKASKELKEAKKSSKKNKLFSILNDTIMPASFVSTQDEEEVENQVVVDKEKEKAMLDMSKTIKDEINALFELSCFKIDEIQVSVYDENTLLVEFQGDDSALLIGKEGYRYKALSYMLFNWINTKYQVQLRLEIAEFLKNQEESISRYLINVHQSIERDGKAQTKILDGVLVQIALKELRDRYPEKYIAIRSTRDGLKYIIVNDYLSHTKYD